MIRILQIGMSSNLGGIETFIMNLYRSIDRSKIQFDFVDFSEKGLYYENEIKQMGGNIYKVVSRRKNWVKNKKMLEKIIEENDYKIIHYNTNTLSYYTPVEIALKKNIKIILHSHSEWKGKKLKTILLHKIHYFKFLKASNKIIKLACSNEAGKYLFGNKEFKIIKNGIDIDKFRFDYNKRIETRKKLKIGENTTVIGHVGAFRKEKNHKLLIDVYNEYLKINENSILVLLGEGPLKNQIKAKVRKLGIENKVEFLGNIDNVEYFYPAFDIFLLPSLFEGLAIVLIEAQTSGVNCLISNTITKESKINSNVVRFDINRNAKDWADEIEKLQKSVINRTKINSNLLQWDKKYLAAEMEEIYTNLVNKY